MAKEEKTEELEPKNDLVHRLFVKEQKITNYRLFINDFAIEAHEFDAELNKLMDANPQDTLEIDISSPGGACYDLKRLENVCQEFFYGRVTTRLNPYGFSCGALMFIMGDRRIAYENSEIMFHNVWYFTGGKRSDIEEEVRHNAKIWDSYFSKLLCPFFKQNEIKSLLKGKEYWFDTLEMCKRGIATDVYAFGTYIKARDYIDIRENKEKRKEFLVELSKDIENLSQRDAEWLAVQISQEIPNQKS